MTRRSGGSVAWRNFVRVLLVPNHVFLGLAALHLWRPPEGSPLGPAEVLEGALRYRVSTSQSATPLVATIMLTANAAGFIAIQTSRWNHTTAFLWAMMCIATGALGGFLFGVPRVSIEAGSTTHRPNSNIEVVLDWLTKIIVGVGLIEFRKIGEFPGRLV